MTEVVIGGAAFNVRLEGDEDKEIVVLAHQLGGALDVFDDVLPALLERFRVLRFDSRGHGASTIDGAPYSLTGFARDALGLLDALGIERAHWIGLSMGAMIGQALMTLAPGRVSRAMLANTAARLGAPDLWNGRIAAIRAGGGRGMAKATEARWFTPEFRARAPQAVARVMQTFRKTPVEGYAGACAALRDADLSESIRAIKNGVLVVAGARDASAPPALARFVAEAIPGARLMTLDTAHISPVEDPDGFAAAAIGFLTGPDPAPRRAPGAGKPAPRRAASKRPALAIRTPAKSPTESPAKALAKTPAKAPEKPPAAPKGASPAQASSAKVAKAAGGKSSGAAKPSAAGKAKAAGVEWAATARGGAAARPRGKAEASAAKAGKAAKASATLAKAQGGARTQSGEKTRAAAKAAAKPATADKAEAASKAKAASKTKGVTKTRTPSTAVSKPKAQAAPRAKAAPKAKAAVETTASKSNAPAKAQAAPKSESAKKPAHKTAAAAPARASRAGRKPGAKPPKEKG